MTGIVRYVLTLARAGRIRLLAWPLALAGITAMSSASIKEFYEEPASRTAYASALDMADVMTALGGASGGVQQLGGIIANEMAIIVLSTVAIAGILLAVASTRGEEDAGRTELLTARPVARLAPLIAGIVPVVASLALLALLSVVAMTAFGVPLTGTEAGVSGPSDGGALPYGLLLFAYGFFFAGIGFVCAELAQDARSAKAVALAFFGLAYMVRIGINGAGEGVMAGGDEVGLSWITPLGWFDAVAPFGAMRWEPLCVLVGTGAALLIVALILRVRRDLGSGVIAARPGRTSARAWLGTPAGLTWRLARTSVLSWLLGTVALAALMGSQLPAWVKALQESKALLQSMGMEADAGTVTHMTMAFCALLAAAAGIAHMSSVAAEENSERLMTLMAQPVSRLRLWLASMLMSLASAVGITVVSGLVYTGTGKFALAGDTGVEAFSVPDAALTTGVFLVPTVLLVALAALWVGYCGRSPWPAWAVFGVGATLLFLGPQLNIPDWASNLGVYNAVGKVPMESVEWLAIAIELGLAVVACVVATVCFTRRDVL